MTAAVLPQERTTSLTLMHFLAILGCEGILIGYMLSMAVYKTWYIATAGALAIVTALVALGLLSIRGVFTMAVPMALTFVYYYVQSYYVRFGDDGRRFYIVAAAVGVPVAVVFFLTARNVSLRSLAEIFLRIPFYLTVIGVWQYLTQPHISRIGGLGLQILPFVVPFCWYDIVWKRRPRRAMLSLGVLLVIAVISRSRAPLVAVMFAGAIAFFSIGRGVGQRVKLLFAGTAMLSIVFAVLMMFAPTRLAILMSLGRLLRFEVATEGVWAPVEEDDTRQKLDRLFLSLMWFEEDAVPYGIGYRITEFHYASRWGDKVNLHNMYQAWLLEGGLFVFGLMLYILIRHFRGLRRAARTSVSPELRAFAVCTSIGTMGLLLFGMFHQAHEAPMFWAALGMGAAIAARARDERRELRT